MEPARHIAVVTETYAPEINGVALTLGRLVEGLRRLGHTVSVVRPRQKTHNDHGRHAMADVFLFPSETETFGNVTLEAMASGLVVIRDGHTGFAVPLGDSSAFAVTTLRCVLGDVAMAEMRQRAREYALSLDWTTVARRFAALLLTRKETGCHSAS